MRSSTPVQVWLVVAFLILLSKAASAGDDGGATDAPRFDLVDLQDPTTKAVTFGWDRQLLKGFGRKLAGEYVNQLQLELNAKGLLPLHYHPSERLNSAIGLALNWVTESHPCVEPEGLPRQCSPYFGQIALKVGEEAAPDPVTNKFRINDFNIGLGLAYDLPYTKIDPYGLLSSSSAPAGTEQLSVGLEFLYVFERNPLDTTYLRFDFFADWGLPVGAGSGIYLYPHYELSLGNNSRANHFFQAELARYIGASEEGFVLFLRYVSGRQAPEFVRIDEWEFGVGTQF